jgi:hypothetical protein
LGTVIASEKEEEPEAPAEVENVVEKSDSADKKNSKKKSNISYLEKVQRRYVSRLPYIMVPLMIVPVLKKGELAGYLTIMVELKGTTVENYRKLQVDLVLVRDEIFCDLYFAMSRLWLGPEAPEASVIENRIKKRINKYYKKEIAEKARLHVMQFSLLQNS